MSLGSPLHLKGKSWGGQGSALPLPLIDNLKTLPYPITIGGSNNVTFTLAASTSRRVPIFIGDEFVNLTWPVAYTWNNTSNANLHATTGAETTDTDSVLGVWYMYLRYVIATGAISLIPSQGAPAYVQGPGHSTVLGHPGTARDPAYFYTYVGFMVCTTAATPAFRAMTKIGHWYHFADVTVPTTSTFGTTSLYAAALPKLAKFGGEARGTLETGADGTVTIAPSSSSTIGVITVSIATVTITSVVFMPFQLPQDDTSGEFYRTDTVARGDIHVTAYKDIR
jgi:hypothetical protein